MKKSPIGTLRSCVGLVLVAIACASAPAVTGCSLFLTPTKTASGELYQSGDYRYDAYFVAVHEEQTAAARWPDESKSSREPLVSALDLKPGASNSAILSATRKKRDDASLSPAVQRTVASEKERARRMSTKAAELEDLLERGKELKQQAISERRNMGADKADPKKVAEKEEVKREMTAAVDVVETMLKKAQKGAREAEDLVASLNATWSGASDMEASESEQADPPSEPEEPEPVVKKHPAKRAPKKTKPPQKKAAPKPETQERPSEVFVP